MKGPDLTGIRFEMLVAVSYEKPNRGRGRWLCRCDCGSSRMSLGKDLLSGRNISCGCAQGHSRLRHGMTDSKVHRAWRNMLSRCANENNNQYKNYGARGIRVCKRWVVFENFLADMGEPDSDLTLERINNNGNYEPSNCRWASRAEQSRNTRRSKRFMANGRNYTNVIDYAHEHGLNPFTLYKRLGRMPVNDALYIKKAQL